MAVENITFSALRLARWRQFDSVDLSFHPRLTVLTGVNGAGKSTLLNILSSHLGVGRPYLALPEKLPDGRTRFLSGIRSIPKWLTGWLDWSRRAPNDLGEITYSDGKVCKMRVPSEPSLSYSIEYENQQNPLGFHVPSHRLLPMHQQVNHIPFEGITPNSAFHMLVGESYARYTGGHTNSSAMFQLKQILAAWAAIGEGNSTLEASPTQYQAYAGFVEVLRKVIPPEIGFIGVAVRPPEVLLLTKSGKFLIDAASGGLVTIIEIAAMIYTCSLREEVKGGRFVVTMDEPENHLHPSLQRTFLPLLVNAFPTAQFIVATHSPFMVSSLKDSAVYMLRYAESDRELRDQSDSKRIQTTQLDHSNRAGTANAILREVLGVPVTLPSWVEEEIEKIVVRHRHSLDAKSIEAIRLELREVGLEEFFPDALGVAGRQ